MSTTTVSELKERLAHYLQAARDGDEVVITERGRPVAKLVPFCAQRVRDDCELVITPRDPTAPPLREVQVCGLKGYHGLNTTEMLRQDRDLR